ncbi:hypothetical protein [Streptomyces aureoverticillatus]|uniref:hypothetical protein n=1 Tax=Streptomyces aureoverticillatus TaxID=66871 RepID=UPI0013DAF1E9|nr:hypothetical protein [Streptomyces aureoverticillatus]QIB45973.1 hypothetical protein G3H79_25815 [Streptomyces aureoverticillatus]
MGETTGGEEKAPWLARVRKHMPFYSSRGEMGPWEQKEGLRARITELEAILHAVIKSALKDDSRREMVESYSGKAFEELERAKRALAHTEHPRMRRAAHLGAAQSHVDAALNLMVWMASGDDIKALLPQMLALIEEHFSPGDQRRTHATEIARGLQHNGELTLSERAFLAETVSLARRLLRKETLRVRSFVWIVVSVTAGLFLVAVGVAVMTCIWETAVPLCFTPEIAPQGGSASSGIPGVSYPVHGTMFKVVCPSFSKDLPEAPSAGDIMSTARAQDYVVVEIIGVVSASVAAAATLRRIRGTALPYNVPVALALLKLPTGALTAALGLLLMRGGFVPGLSALDSTAQIIAWAVIFGYSQQLFTRFVDSQGQAVLDSVHGPNSLPAAPTSEARP